MILIMIKYTHLYENILLYLIFVFSKLVKRDKDGENDKILSKFYKILVTSYEKRALILFSFSFLLSLPRLTSLENAKIYVL